MLKATTTRQRIRKLLLLVTLLLFPITLNYLSPYVIIDGAANGIINGSLIMFSLMFLSSLLVGRLFCGWVCPGGAVGEFATRKPVKNKRLDLVKWFIWVPWLTLIVVLAIQAGGYQQVDFFHMTETGISVSRPMAWIILLIVVGIFLGLALLFGRRAGCHTICWMAPFMILGRKIRNRFGWHSLRLVANPDACLHCKACNRTCPMSLDVNGMVQSGAMENSECILCGSCVDGCSRKVIHYSFSKGK